MKKSLIVSFMIMALIYTMATPSVSAQDCSTPGAFREVMKQLIQFNAQQVREASHKHFAGRRVRLNAPPGFSYLSISAGP